MSAPVVGPGVRSVTSHEARAAARAVIAGGGVVRTLSGTAMTTDDAAFDELARMLEFPDYFGRTWDAVWDCLRDLSWLPAPAYLLVIEHPDAVLSGERPAQRVPWRDRLRGIAAEWAEPVAQGEPWDRDAVPFTVLLVH